MPKPYKNERREQFISRCIPIVLEEGTAKNQAQAVAICVNMWRNKPGKKVIDWSLDDYSEEE